MCPERPGFPARRMASATAFATPGGLGREVAALSRYMYGTDRDRSGPQRDDENEALAEGLPFFQPVPIRETVDRDAVDARDLVEGVPLVHLVARGPLPDVPRRVGGGGGFRPPGAFGTAACAVRDSAAPAGSGRTRCAPTFSFDVGFSPFALASSLHPDPVPLREARQRVPLPHGNAIPRFSTPPSPDARPSAPSSTRMCAIMRLVR